MKKITTKKEALIFIYNLLKDYDGKPVRESFEKKIRETILTHEYWNSDDHWEIPPYKGSKNNRQRMTYALSRIKHELDKLQKEDMISHDDGRIYLKTDEKDDYLWEGFINFFLTSEDSEDHEPNKSGEWIKIMDEEDCDSSRFVNEGEIQVKSFGGRRTFTFRKDGLVIFEGEELDKPMDHFVVRADHIHFYDCYDETENWPYEVL